MKSSSLLLLLLSAPALSLAQTTGDHGETIDEHGIIIAAPADALLKEFTRTGYSLVWDQNDNLLYQTSQTGTIEIAFCTDGTFFMHDLISQAHYDTWVKGTMANDELTILAGQKVYYDANYNATIHLQNFEIFLQIGSIEDSQDPVITFHHETLENGRETLKLNSPEGAGSILYYTIGSVWDDDNTIDELGDFGTVYIDDTNYVPLPEDIEVVLAEGTQEFDCTIHGWSYREYHDVDFTGKVAFDGNDVYIRGLYSFMPEGLLKGKREGNLVTFPQHQFMGLDGRLMPIYAVAVSTGLDEDGIECTVEEPNWTLTYDPQTHTLQGGSGDKIGETYVRFSELPYYQYGISYDSLDEIHIAWAGGEDALSEIAMPFVTAPSFDIFGRISSDKTGLKIQNGHIQLR